MPIECAIHHNSFPAKPLPFFLLRSKLGLFGAFDPPPTTLRSSSRPAHPGLALFVQPPLAGGPRERCSTPPGIGFVFPRPLVGTNDHNSFSSKHLPFFLLRRKLGLFGAFCPPSPAPGTSSHRASPGNWVCLARRMRSRSCLSSKPKPSLYSYLFKSCFLAEISGCTQRKSLKNRGLYLAKTPRSPRAGRRRLVFLALFASWREDRLWLRPKAALGSLCLCGEPLEIRLAVALMTLASAFKS